jgi:glycosyltransferase involved in cell wall biosynthesis
MSREDLVRLGVSEYLLNAIRIVEAPYSGDIFTSLRKVFRYFGFKDSSSYTEQLKEKINLTGSSKFSYSRTFVDFAMRQYQAFFAFPDTEWPWIRSALRTANTLLLKEHFDVLLSSSPFPSVHCISSVLKKNYKIKWIADFRDPWSQSHNYSLPKFRFFLDSWLEKKIISKADLVTTVSEGFAKKLRLIHGSKVNVVRNGYQPPWQGEVSQPTNRLIITYTGTIYAGKQDPTMILRALKNLIESERIPQNSIRINFYGRYDSALQSNINDFALCDVVLQHGIVPRADVRKIQRESHLLLVLQWEDLEEEGIFPLKFYEYLSSMRTIIATGGSDQSELSQILNETGSGYSAVSIGKCELFLEKAYQILLSDGTLKYDGRIESIEQYSFENSSKTLLKIMYEQLN